MHPQNPQQWITENGRFFLNLNDTAYFLLCARDGNGDAVSDEQARQYVRDDVSRGITSMRCFLASSPEGFSESSKQWPAWYFPDATHDRLQLENLQCADRRMRMLLDEFPDVAVQLIMFPLEAYARDDRKRTGKIDWFFGWRGRARRAGPRASPALTSEVRCGRDALRLAPRHRL